jgi:hypothetical protein
MERSLLRPTSCRTRLLAEVRWQVPVQMSFGPLLRSEPNSAIGSLSLTKSVSDGQILVGASSNSDGLLAEVREGFAWAAMSWLPNFRMTFWLEPASDAARTHYPIREVEISADLQLSNPYR